MESSSKKIPRNKLPALLLVLLAVVVLLVVIWRLDSAPATNDAYASADTIDVVPEVSGRIVELAVSDNQQVKQGDLLFRIDPRTYEMNLALNRPAIPCAAPSRCSRKVLFPQRMSIAPERRSAPPQPTLMRYCSRRNRPPARSAASMRWLPSESPLKQISRSLNYILKWPRFAHRSMDGWSH